MRSLLVRVVVGSLGATRRYEPASPLVRTLPCLPSLPLPLLDRFLTRPMNVERPSLLPLAGPRAPVLLSLMAAMGDSAGEKGAQFAVILGSQSSGAADQAQPSLNA